MKAGIDATHFRHHVIRPTLYLLEPAEIPYSLAAENLLLGTVAAESSFRHLEQLSKGRALGLYQIEPLTHEDIWEHFLRYHKPIQRLIIGLITFRNANRRPPPNTELIDNLKYATAIARLLYWRVPEPLPDPLNVKALGKYWKKYYNTNLGKGNIAHYASQWQALIGDDFGIRNTRPDAKDIDVKEVEVSPI